MTLPGQYTVLWTGSITKTNRENINVKYNILKYSGAPMGVEKASIAIDVLGEVVDL